MKTRNLVITFMMTCIGALVTAGTAHADPPDSSAQRHERADSCPHTAHRRAKADTLSRHHPHAAVRDGRDGREGSDRTDVGERAGAVFGILAGAIQCSLEENCKTPCEELEEAMEAESGEAPWGGVGCYDGEVLICVFPENFVQDHDDDDGAGIAKKCIQAHEDAHGHQCKCDKKGKGLKKPQNNLKSNAHEGAALSAEIECYAASSCATTADPAACQAVVDAFKADACSQYEARMSKKHTKC